jgi:hypothetical protein
VQSVKLPADLIVSDGRPQGLQKADQPLFGVIQRNAKFCETTLKLLASAQAGDASLLDNLFTVAHAQVKYLQEELAALVVQSSFDPTVSRFFRSLQRQSGFSPESLENLRSAAAIAAVYKPQRDRRDRGAGAGGFGGYPGGYGGRGRGGGDLFQQQTFRNFPTTRGGRQQQADQHQFHQSQASGN